MNSKQAKYKEKQRRESQKLNKIRRARLKRFYAKIEADKNKTPPPQETKIEEQV